MYVKYYEPTRNLAITQNSLTMRMTSYVSWPTKDHEGGWNRGKGFNVSISTNLEKVQLPKTQKSQANIRLWVNLFFQKSYDQEYNVQWKKYRRVCIVSIFKEKLIWARTDHRPIAFCLFIISPTFVYVQLLSSCMIMSLQLSCKVYRLCEKLHAYLSTTPWWLEVRVIVFVYLFFLLFQTYEIIIRFWLRLQPSAHYATIWVMSITGD